MMLVLRFDDASLGNKWIHIENFLDFSSYDGTHIALMSPI